MQIISWSLSLWCHHESQARHVLSSERERRNTKTPAGPSQPHVLSSDRAHRNTKTPAGPSQPHPDVLLAGTPELALRNGLYVGQLCFPCKIQRVPSWCSYSIIMMSSSVSMSEITTRLPGNLEKVPRGRLPDSSFIQKLTSTPFSSYHCRWTVAPWSEYPNVLVLVIVKLEPGEGARPSYHCLAETPEPTCMMGIAKTPEPTCVMGTPEPTCAMGRNGC